MKVISVPSVVGPVTSTTPYNVPSAPSNWTVDPLTIPVPAAGEKLTIEGGGERVPHPNSVYASMNPIVELNRIVPRGAYVGLWAVVPPPNDTPLVPVDSRRPETMSSASDEILTAAPIPGCCVQ